MSFSQGENVGAYRIVEQLGSGGMATVFKAFHPALDRYVAIKVVHPVFKGNTNFLARFQREARVVAKLDHANIVPVYDFNEHEGSPYLVMRFIEGETLKARLDRGRLSLSEIFHVIRPMGDALGYAHDQGVLHRDIKPSNVLLRQDRKVFLSDFGLARIMEAGESSLTRDAMIGTPHYIAPEQALGQSALDARTDIYSFGVVLYELFTGRVPFQADTPYAVIHDHIYSPLPLPTTINPNLPPALEQVLLKALAKNPDDRYSTAAKLVTATEKAFTAVAPPPPTPHVSAPTAAVAPAIESAQGPTAVERGRPSAAVRPARTGRAGRRHWWLAGLGIVGVLAVIAAAVMLVLALGQDKAPENDVVTPRSAAQVATEQPADEKPAATEPPPEQIEPDQDFDALLERGVDLANKEDFNGALDAFERASEIDPHQTVVYHLAALMLQNSGEPEAAIDYVRRGVEANPNDVDLRLNLLRALVAKERWEEAAAEAEWLIERAPELAEAHAFLSVHLSLRTDNMDAAEHHATQAKKLEPEASTTHFAMGVLHWKHQDFEPAREEFERALHDEFTPPYLRRRIEFFLERMEEEETQP
jgi:tetratricopeptide (TPR) repeat protein